MESVVPQEAGDSVRSVDRALDLLSALGRSGRPVGPTELSQTTGMPKTTTLRLLSVLEHRGLVHRSSGRYELGFGIISLAHVFLQTNSLARVALPVLERLSSESGETASLYVREGFDRVVVQRVESPHTLRYAIGIGQRLPLHLGSAGHVLCAAMADGELKALLDRIPEIRLASGSTMTRAEFAQRLEAVRQRGYDISYGERELGLASIAAPVLGAVGETIAVVMATGPQSRMTEEKIDRLVGVVQRAGRDIAQAYSQL